MGIPPIKRYCLKRSMAFSCRPRSSGTFFSKQSLIYDKTGFSPKAQQNSSKSRGYIFRCLSSEGIKCNVTLIFSANQALLAARAGAAFVSPFLGRLDDISRPGIDLIRDIAEIFAVHDIDTEIIAASVRNPIHVTDCALAGADIATVPYGVIEQMTKHPLTDIGIEKFQKDYIAVFGE